MTLLPIVGREMRAAARQPSTYYVRVVGAGTLLLTSVFFAFDSGFEPNLGGRLFGMLHLALFAAIWILVPAMAADCLSRERREGTLGLLFLTGLKSGEIVAAKGMAYGLRALTLWLAVLPVMTIPFLMGGLAWTQALGSVMLNFSSICWALAAALTASAWGKVSSRALLRAMVLAVVYLSLLTFITGVGAGTVLPNYHYIFSSGLSVILSLIPEWQDASRVAPAHEWLWILSQTTFISMLALLLAVLLAGARIRRIWQDELPSRWRLWWQATFCQPIFWRSFFRRWLGRHLERNPVGWLERRTWTGRVLTSAWLAVVVSLYSALLSERNFFRDLVGVQRAIAWLMLGSVAFTATGSFRRERETGLMELLLISPLGERRIIWGRLRGLWGQFVPAMGLLLGLWAYLLTFIPDQGDSEMILFVGAAFVTMPIIGLYFSLRCRNSIVAFVATIVIGLIIPMVLPDIFLWFRPWQVVSRYIIVEWVRSRWSNHLSLLHFVLTAFCQVLPAALCAVRLHQRLKRRAFPLGRQEA